MMSGDTSTRLSSRLARMLGVDLRSLAALRIGLALVLIYDLIQRSRDLVAHYSDFGLLPRADAIAESHSRWLHSLHFMSGAWQIQALLFLLAGLLALAFLIGYKTRLVTVLSWFLLCSLQTRNLFVNGGGDLMLRIILFWSMFLPLGARYSVDSLLALPSKQDSKTFLSAGTLAYFVQFFVLYWFSVILKSGPQWWSEGSAIYYALSLDYLATSLAQAVLDFPWVLKAATYGTLGIEIIGPLLLVSPFFNAQMRMIGICGFLALHLGILLTLRIGIFPVINIISLLFFLPAPFWDFLSRCWSSETRASRRFLRAADARLRWVGERVHTYRARRRPGADNQSYPNGSQRPANFRLSLLENLMIAGLLVYLLAWNIGTVPGSGIKLSERVRSLGYFLRIDQEWRLFAPYPPKNDGWYVIPGKLQNGRIVDLFADGKAVSWKKPELISGTFKNHHWRKYMEVVRTRPSLFRYYAAFLCRDWNRRHDPSAQLAELDIVFMLERTQPNYEYSPTEKRFFLHHSCAPEEKPTVPAADVGGT